MTGAELGERLRPTPAELVDVGFAAVLALLGVVGFRTVFAGNAELIVGLPAVLLGAAIAYVLVKLEPPLLGGVALATIAFFVLGGPVALRHRAVGGILPSPSAVTGLADGVLNGWIRLLTTLPPAGRSGDLLAIPYLCGYVGAAAAVALALRFPRRWFCVIPPAVVLAVSVLMGTKDPASLLLQGVVFAALTIAWISIRHRRNRVVTSQALSRPRLAGAAALLVASALSGVVVGPRLPGAETSDRYVLRDDVEPPFNPLTEPSPLASYRNYTNQDVREEAVVSVDGLPEDGRLRIASMDAYSGTVWEVTGDGSVLAGQYQRVGTEIPSDGDGRELELEVEIRKPEGVWVPLAGDVTGIDFLGSRGAALDADLRVSTATDTAAVPSELRAGDRYRFTAEFVELPARDLLLETPIDPRYQRDERTEVPPEFVSRAADWAADQPTPYAEMVAVAEGLRTEGAFTDGGEDANPVSPPGHGLRRLLDFIDLAQPFGNGEQFAAAQGLLAQARGVPVRVVMGFVNREGRDRVTFRGEDLEAWVEVPLEGYGWVPVDGTPPEDQLPDPQKQPRSKTENPEPQPPPPTTVPPPTSIPDELAPEEPEEDEEDEASGGGLPGWLLAAVAALGIPVVVLGAASGAIVLLKRRRRVRRRRRGTPSQRVAGSFSELVDHARDRGEPVPPRATRRELATIIGDGDDGRAASLARQADDAVFGPAEPSDESVDAAWTELTDAHAARTRALDRRRQLRAALNPTSLRPPR